MKNIIITIILLLFTNSNFGQNIYKYKQPKRLNDGWKTNTLKSQRIDTISIYKFFNQAINRDSKLHSILLIKDQELIIEEYFNDYNTEKQQDLRSATKSIISILIGIAIDKGYIDDINDPISKYLKEPKPQKNLSKQKESIRIKDLLTMSSGLDCNDWDKKSKGQEDKVYKKKDWLQYTLDLPMVNKPGEVANYCSMGVVLLAEIINQTSGMTIEQFANKHLFSPLEINHVNWGHTSEQEVISSAKRLYLNPRDMAKIGLLVLNKGNWDNKQIVSKKWIEDATSPKTKISNINYGYLWWEIPFKINNKIIKSIVATGNGGQYIMIFPEINLVTVFTGGAYNSEEDKLPFAIIENVFLPAYLY